MFKYRILLSIIFILILFGCDQQADYYSEETFIVLTGESHTWELSGYEIKLTPKSFEIGNGTLTMKNTTDYLSDSFSYEVYATINEEDQLIQQHHSSGQPVNLALKKIGSITGEKLYLKNGKNIALRNVSAIYMLVEWKNQDGQSSVERIELYKRFDIKC